MDHGDASKTVHAWATSSGPRLCRSPFGIAETADPIDATGGGIGRAKGAAGL
jgi:hypothetical protein